MGIHYCFGYSGYEKACLKTIIDLLDMYCINCHTNEDVQSNCNKCEVGMLLNKCKEYLSELYYHTEKEIKRMEKNLQINGDYMRKEGILYRKIMREIKKVKIGKDNLCIDRKDLKEIIKLYEELEKRDK